MTYGQTMSLSPAATSDPPSLIKVIILLLSPQGIVKEIQVNPPFELSLSNQDTIGKHWFTHCIPEHIRQEAIATFDALFDAPSQKLINQACPVLLQKNEEKMLYWYSLPHLDKQQKITGMWLSGFDFSEQLASRDIINRELKRTQAFSKFVLDHALEAIITINTQGIIESFNCTAESMFGYSADEIIGKNVKVLMPSPYKESHDNYIAAYLKTGEKKIIGIDREVKGLRRDGSQFPMELSVSEFYVENERGFTGIIRDISERKEAEEKLRQRDEELRELRDKMAHIDRLNLMGEMATGIAHELNQPLTAIANYAQAGTQLLDSTIHNAKDIIYSLQQINNQAQRAGDVIRRLRAMVTKQPKVYEQASINALIEDGIELAKNDERLKDIVISTHFCQSMPMVDIDKIQIQQVLLNLIINAIDALSDPAVRDKQIIISTVLHDDTICVSVADTGRGLSESDAKEVFNPFFTTKEHGMGMGLTICQSIINAHGGHLTINTDNKEQTEFYFTLPISYKI